MVKVNQMRGVNFFSVMCMLCVCYVYVYVYIYLILSIWLVVCKEVSARIFFLNYFPSETLGLQKTLVQKRHWVSFESVCQKSERRNQWSFVLGLCVSVCH